MSPLAVKKLKLEKKTEMIEVLDQYLGKLLYDMKVDFIALGEVNYDLIDYLQRTLAKTKFEVLNGMIDVGSSTFKECFIYDKERLEIIKHEPVVKPKRESGKHRVAQKIILNVLTNSDPVSVIHVLTSHWTSNTNDYSESPNRHQLAMALRDTFDQICEVESEPNVILMGDYNEEPFSKVMQEQLRASRDLRLVKSKRRLLYNPLWKSMSNMQWDVECAGSYFYRGGDVNQWTTFDQIILSKALLTGRTWAYQHDSQNIAELTGLVELVRNPDIKFDHLPIFCHIKRIQ